MRLLVDLGNTRLKWAFWDGRTLHGAGAAAHADISDALIAKLCAQTPQGDAVWLACVAPDAPRTRLIAALDACGRHVMSVLAPAECLGWRSAYAEPQRLGVDRFLAMLALRRETATDALVVSLGTAITIDLMDAGGVHRGGAILPGLGLLASLLPNRASALRHDAFDLEQDFGTSTEACLGFGTWLAASGAIARAHALATVQLGHAPQLVLAGGDAARLGASLQLAHRLAPDLVLQGLGAYSETVAGPA